MLRPRREAVLRFDLTADYSRRFTTRSSQSGAVNLCHVTGGAPARLCAPPEGHVTLARRWMARGAICGPSYAMKWSVVPFAFARALPRRRQRRRLPSSLFALLFVRLFCFLCFVFCVLALADSLVLAGNPSQPGCQGQPIEPGNFAWTRVFCLLALLLPLLIREAGCFGFV